MIIILEIQSSGLSNKTKEIVTFLFKILEYISKSKNKIKENYFIHQYFKEYLN